MPSLLHPPLPAPRARQRWHQLYGSARSLAIAEAVESDTRPYLVIARDTRELDQLRAELGFFLGQGKGNTRSIHVLPDWEVLPYDVFSPHPDIISERLAALAELPRLESAGAGGAPKNETVRLSELAGKAVLLDFWASWCGPCREQAPIIDRVSRELSGRGLVALGIVTDDEPDAARRFLAEHPVHYPSVVDEQRDAARAFAVQGLPTLVALDRSGRVVAVRRQFVREAELRGIAEAALKD